MIDLKNTPYWTLFGEVWNFAKKNFDVQGTDEYWSRVTEEAQELQRKYRGTEQEEMARDMARALVAEITRIHQKSGA